MPPKLYLYSEVPQNFELHLGNFSALEGLSLINPDLSITITDFGATLYKKYGWATEKELPPLKTVGDALSFLNTEGDIGLFIFEANITNFGDFSVHENNTQTCHFKLKTKQQCLALLKAAIPPPHSGKLIHTLLNNHNTYFSCDTAGNINKLSSSK